jgi:hypothetical protein
MKQETIEEAETLGDFIKKESKSYIESVGIVKGAKWQAERMYSEEDMRKCWDACKRFDKPISEGDAPNFNELIEQFKKN